MPAQTINNSPDINQLDFAAKFDLSAGTLTITDQSVYLAGRISHVVGAIISVVSPSGTTFYDTTDFTTPDIVPNTSLVGPAIPLPKFGIVIEFNDNYTITYKMKDSAGNIYTLIKTFELLKPVQKQDCKNDEVDFGNNGRACLSIYVDSVNSKLVVQDQTAYVYAGQEFLSEAINITLYPPPELQLSSVVSVIKAFSIQPYNGTYTIVLNNTATYQFPDSITVVVGYYAKRCIVVTLDLDLCEAYCVFDSLKEQYRRIAKLNPTVAADLSAQLYEAMLLFNAITGDIRCGRNTHKNVTRLNEVLGTKCETCCPKMVPQSPVPLNGTNEINVIGSNLAVVTPFKVGNTITYVVDVNPCGDQLKNCNTFLANDSVTGIDISTGAIITIDPLTVPVAKNSTKLVDIFNAINTAIANIISVLVALVNTVTTLTLAGSAGISAGSDLKSIVNGFGDVKHSGFFDVDISVATNGALVTTLPVAARPKRLKRFMVVAEGVFFFSCPFEISIATNGQVTVWWNTAILTVTTGEFAVFIDGISYNVEN